jgi:aspartyl-tRNA(Asn)/glutamyl-tRNA(Gln) amidotransferase subunit C
VSAVIDEAQIRLIAKLSRLKLSDEEVRLFTGQLAEILDYVGQIEALDTEGVKPLAHALPVTNVLREDEPRKGLSSAQALANAPDVEGDYFRVPVVIPAPTAESARE